MTIFFYSLAGLSLGYGTLILSAINPVIIINLAIGTIVFLFSRQDFFKFHIILAFCAGFMADIVNQNRIPYEAIFLIALVILTNYLKSKFIDLSNRMTAFIYFLIISMIYICFHFLVNFHSIHIMGLLYSTFASLILFVIFSVLKLGYKVNL